MKISWFPIGLLLVVDPVVAADLVKTPCCYLSVAGGVSSLRDIDVDTGFEVSFDPNWTGALGVGMELGNGFRGEVEFSILHSDFDRVEADGFSQELDGDAVAAVGLVKAAYDFHVAGLLPYVAISIGVARFDVDIDPPANFADSGWAAAGGLEAGLAFPLNESLGLFTRTQFLVLSDVELSDGPGSEVRLDHPTFLSATAGLRIDF